MDFERFKAIVDEKRNYGVLAGATVQSELENPSCGDKYVVYLSTDEDERILQASFTTTGCSFGFVALSIACDYSRGKNLAEIKTLRSEEIEGLFQFPERRRHYAELAAEAFRRAAASASKPEPSEIVECT